MAQDALQTNIHTTFPGMVQSFNAAALTAVVQPAVMYQVRNEAGVWNWIKLPLLLDCPVQFPSGGGFTLTFPLAPGDEVLVHIAERCIDAWWASGGTQPQAKFRMHDLSDGFVVPKVWSQPKKIGGVSTSTAQFRSDDGSTYVEVAGGQIVSIVAPTRIVLDTPLVQITGAVEVQNTGTVAQPFQVTGQINATGNVIAGTGTGDQVGLQTHTHTQPNDSAGDVEQPTNAPTPGT